MKSRVRAKLRKNRIIAVCVGIAALAFCVIMFTQILSMNSSNKELEKRRDRLTEQLAFQKNREAELDADENYVKTNDYIEEKARSVGYVYPDEIIFQKED